MPRFALALVLASTLTASSAVAQDSGADGDRLREGRIDYAITMRMGDDEQSFEGVRRIERAEHDGHAVWRTVDADPSSETADTTEVDATTLLPLRRAAMGQGMAYVFSDGKAIGELNYGGGPTPFEVDLEGPATASEAAFELLLAGMDLANDTMRVFDPYGQRVREMVLTVGAPVTVATDGGTFDTIPVDLVPLQGDGLERAEFYVLEGAPHYVVKAFYQLPRIAGGGSFDIEVTAVDLDE